MRVPGGRGLGAGGAGSIVKTVASSLNRFAALLGKGGVTVMLVDGVPADGIWPRPCTRRMSKTKFAVAKDGAGGVSPGTRGARGLPRGIARRRMLN